jgi:putative serine protease PepD
MVRADISGTGPRGGLVEADPGCCELAGCVQLVEPESAGLTKEPIVTDASAWRQTAGNGAHQARVPLSTGPWAHPAPGAAGQNGSRPAPGTWWSDALSDPWRDPNAHAVVVTNPPDSRPELEPLGALREPPGRPPFGMVIAIAAFSALIAGVLGGTLGYVFAARNGGGVGGTTLGSKTAALTQRAPDSIAGLVKKVLPTVVTLRVKSGSGTSLGSGFIVSTGGYVVTNNHVVEGGSGPIVITFSDSSTASGSVLGSDPESDLAVVKVDKGGLPAVEFGDSDAVQVGDPVVAIGAPLALSNTVTYGIVSALDRPLRTEEDNGGARYYSAIQTDAAVNQGNSGGPLFDAGGRVIGVNSVIGSLADDQQHAGNVGLAFSIPINQAKRVAQDIIDTGKARRTVIGAEIDSSYQDGGARLSSVAAGGPAAVTKIGAGVVEESWDLIALVRKYPPGATIPVEYTRDGSHQTLRVTLMADGK